jgi:glycosyltransferase involved in cell wall biosynthesis
MRILYLYAELMGYQIPVFDVYVRHYGCEVHVVHWDQRKLTPYKPPTVSGVVYYPRSAYSRRQLVELAATIDPNLVYVSGWMDRGYLSVCRFLRRRGIPVASGFDDQWMGTLRQRAAAFTPGAVRRMHFSHAWVFGPYQFEFAARLGFRKQETLFNCCSADVRLFNDAHLKAQPGKRLKYPHRLLCVARFDRVKGIDLLVSAWRNIRRDRKDWELSFVGNGPLGDSLAKEPDVCVKPFAHPDQLVDEVAASGCLVLPSRIEPWGLVLHEFAAAGLPIVCSDACGAAPLFVVPGDNGYVFQSEDVGSLERSLLKVINSSDEILRRMSARSHEYGQRITPELTAASFMSILEN